MLNNPSSIKHNIIANVIGKVWTGLITLAFVPWYIKIIGIEGYGLIGVYTMILILFSVFDMGLSTTLNRELALLSSLKEDNQVVLDTVRTFEIIYWSIGFIIGGGIVILAPLIARHWLNAQGLSIELVEQTIRIMGIIVFFQWPVSLYSGGLMGLQRQVMLNGIKGTIAIIQSGGAILVLLLISPTIISYFIWQIIVSVIQVIVIAMSLWISLSKLDSHATFRKRLWLNNWRFAAGMAGITLLSVTLTQLDKIIFSKFFTLEMFGYYTFASLVANSLQFISNPIFTAIFPRFSQMVVQKNEKNLILLYHKGCQIMSVMIFSIGVMISLFSKELISLWVNNSATVNNTYLLVSLIVIGTAFNSVMVLPFCLQLAHGWTKLSFYKNIVSIIFFIPLLFLLVTNYGAIGAAIAWVVLNTGYVLLEVPIMHHRLLKHDMWRWYFIDIGLPLVVSLLIGILFRIFLPIDATPLMIGLWIGTATLLTLLFSSFSVPFPRELIKTVFYK